MLSEEMQGMQGMETLRLLADRKSVRVYQDKPVSADSKKQILELTLRAATAGNMTLYTIIDVTDSELKKQLSVSCDNQPFIATAPLVFIFCADYRRWYRVFTDTLGTEQVRRPGMGDFMLAASDTLIAAQTAVTAMEAFGLGSCYIGDILENYEYHKELLRLPKYVVPVAMVCAGYPTQQQAQRTNPPRFSTEDIVHENAYSLEKSDRMGEMLKQRDHWREEEFEARLRAFCTRKWNGEFSVEMSRSVERMLEQWQTRSAGDRQ